MRIRSAKAPKRVSPARRVKAGAGIKSVAPAVSPADAAQIMGVSEPELTPNVQRALLSLMGEVDQLRKDAESLRDQVRDLELLADHDVMLPVLNRRAFLREVSRALALAERHKASSALVYLDLNGLKSINDRYGHAAGDAALHHVAGVLTAHVRETDSVGRLGGDEFGVVLSLAEMAGAEAKAADLMRMIEETPFTHEGEAHEISAACGVHPLTAGRTADQALAEADAAMYENKQARKQAAAG